MGDRMGENGQRDASEAWESGKDRALVVRGRLVIFLDRLQRPDRGD
jgi:hypothetical protein